MAGRVFRSKVDWWIRLLLGVAMAGMFVACATVILERADPLETTVTILTCIAGLGLIVWVLVGTYYTVDRGLLVVRSGPFRWRIPIDQITAVEKTGSAISSPALSLDRLRIRYGKRRGIMVSPADKAGFLAAIGHGPAEADSRGGRP